MRRALLLLWVGVLSSLLMPVRLRAADDSLHWAFRKPVRPTPPAVADAAWVRTPVDRFILTRLDKAGLTPSPPAERAVLLRRVTFDLTGLPPTPDEVVAFLADSCPDAYERVVERLLASLHHGERWAQHWLDVARYAESNGYEMDAERPHAWRYRDYVARAFNDDKPYDRFLTEQLAGDLLARGRDARSAADLLVATGFNRCGPIHLVSGNVDPEMTRQEFLTEITSGLGLAVLGLTVGCARCHDHKFDPLPQSDFYRLQAFFAAGQAKEVDIASPEEKAAFDRRTTQLNALMKPLRQQVDALDAPYRARLAEVKKAKLDASYREALAVDPKKRTPVQKKLADDAQTLLRVTWDEVLDALSPADRAKRAALRARIHAVEAQLPPNPAHAWSIADADKVPVTHILKRGELKRPGAVVTPGVPGALTLDAQPAKIENRVDLARWLTSPNHPLTARVLVNRLWQHHFGRGLVATPNDFGVRGAAPTHPELLDWLATEFVASGWSLKHMHRLMVLSNTYRQASSVRPGTTDPDNHLLSRMNRRRLEGEALRDAVLAASGALNRAVGGPMVRVPLEPEVYDLIFTEGEPDGLWHATPDPREYGRRSLYLFAKRNVRQPLFETFDQPDTLSSCAVRPVSTYAPQALILLNGPFLQEQSRRLAARLLREGGADVNRHVEKAHQLALSRRPKPAERQLAREFLESQSELLRDRLRARRKVGVPEGLPDGVDPAYAAALADFCLALLNRNEMLYVE